jgi:hypothetical protein
MLRRTIHPEVRVLDEKQGIVEYTASDESPDSYKEIVKADGWRFDRFQKNSPFVDSHNYASINSLLGRVTDFGIQGKRLVEAVKWAIDVPENELALLGFRMTAAGYLKAVSVGFMPVRTVSPWDNDKNAWREVCEELHIDPVNTDCRCVYLEQQQLELSTCVVGANENALARSYSYGILTDSSVSRITKHFPEFARRVERAITPGRQRSYSFSGGDKQQNAVSEMISALGGKPSASTATPQPQSQMKTVTELKDFSRLTIVSKGLFEAIELARRRNDETEIQHALRLALAALAREKQAAFGNPVDRYLDAEPERRLFWSGLFRKMSGRSMKTDSDEYRVFQKAVSGINMQDTFGAGLNLAIPVAGDIYDLLLHYGAYKYLGLKKMIGQYTKFAKVTGFPNAVFITPTQQGQTTIVPDTSLTGTSISPDANTIACLVEASLAWLQDLKMDLSEPLLTKILMSLAARIDWGCFQGTGADDPSQGMTTGLFVDNTVQAYVTQNENHSITGLVRQDFLNTIALVAPAALQRMDEQPPHWYISPVLIPQLLKLYDGAGPKYLLKTPAETGGEWILVGFPVTWAAQAPSASVQGSKIAVFGNPDAYTVALHEQFEIMASGKGAAFGAGNMQFRGLGRGRSMMREATGFAALQIG